MLKKCTRCGSENKQEYNFCTICGQRFEDSTAEAELIKKIMELHSLCKKENHTLLLSAIPSKSSKNITSLNGNIGNLSEAYIMLADKMPEVVLMMSKNIINDMKKAAGGHQQQSKTL